MYYGDEPGTLWCLAVYRTPYLLRTIFETRASETARARVPSEGFPNCFLVVRDEFEAVGGFDEERFPQHFEESDLAQRLRARFGRPAFGIPAAKIWHHLPRGLARLYHLKSAFMAFQCAHARAAYTGLYGTPLQWLIFSIFGQFAYAAIYLGFIVAGRRDTVALSIAYGRGLVAGWRAGASLRHST
jgi:GT2 family glycosyltransferase